MKHTDIIAEHLRAHLSSANPGNQITPSILTCFAVLWILVAASACFTCVQWLTFCFVCSLIAAKAMFLAHPVRRPLYLATYRTSLHAPLWADLAGYAAALLLALMPPAMPSLAVCVAILFLLDLFARAWSHFSP